MVARDPFGGIPGTTAGTTPPSDGLPHPRRSRPDGAEHDRGNVMTARPDTGFIFPEPPPIDRWCIRYEITGRLGAGYYSVAEYDAVQRPGEHQPIWARRVGLPAVELLSTDPIAVADGFVRIDSEPLYRLQMRRLIGLDA